MNARLDHVVLWVADPVRSAEFFVDVVGLTAVRLDEFRAGAVLFPSVRVSDETILDLMPKTMATPLNAMGQSLSPVAAASAGHPVHHICLAMSEADYRALAERLAQKSIATFPMQNSFGARGSAPHAFYFYDPDGNIFEARYYAA